MPELNPLTNEQIFLKKIAENTGSNYNTGDVSEINPLTIDQVLLKEIAANTAGQSGDITELEEKVSATQDMISDAYDSTHTYNVGDYCIHENALYRCKTASTTGEWDSSKWDAVTVAEELGELTNKVDRGSVTVVADGAKTYNQLLYDLYIEATRSKIIDNLNTVILFIDGIRMRFVTKDASTARLYFGASCLLPDGKWIVYGMILDDDINNYLYGYNINAVFTDMSSIVPAASTQVVLYF